MMKKHGFTLIELLVVIAIIGILALLIILNLAGAAERAKYTKAKAELKTINDAVAIAFVDSQVAASNGWKNLADTDAVSTHTYGIGKILDNKGKRLILSVPQSPGDGFGIYRIFVKSSSNHAATINTPNGDCVFKGGSIYTTKKIDGIIGTEAACNAS